MRWSAFLLLALVSMAPLTEAASTAQGAGFRPSKLFSPGSITAVTVSPSGEWFAAIGSLESAWGVFAMHRGEGFSEAVYRAPRPILALEWIGDDTLVVRHEGMDRAIKELRRDVAVRLRWQEDSISADELPIVASGALVDPLVETDEVVLWGRRDGRKGWAVFRGPVGGLSRGVRWRKSGEPAAGELERVAVLDKPVLHWITDSKGAVRAALVSEGESKWSLRFRKQGSNRWGTVWTETDWEQMPFPVAMTADGERLITLARGDEDTKGLYQLDPESRTLGRVLFSDPNVDVQDVVLDYTRSEILAAVYVRGGQVHYHYFGGFRERDFGEIDGAGSGERVRIASSSRDLRHLVLFVSGPRNPGTFYHFEEGTGERVKLADRIPGIPPSKLAGTETFEVVSADGTKLEAYLTRPPSRTEASARPPLVVLPHGGPIGVQDYNEFDPLVQYLALEGFAVLRVNYRGSWGFGREFLEAGKREWSRGIEDDIDAAVRLVVERELVDPDRMCIAGGSYGGYSALASVIRWPSRYRCAATLNGVTDIPFLHHSDTRLWIRRGRERMAEIVGDIEDEFERLVDISPAYQAHKIEVPVLIAHGSQDVWVDPDHAYRLRAMLELYSKPYDWLRLEAMGHAPDSEEWLRYALVLRRFLSRHLQPAASGGSSRR